MKVFKLLCPRSLEKRLSKIHSAVRISKTMVYDEIGITCLSLPPPSFPSFFLSFILLPSLCWLQKILETELFYFSQFYLIQVSPSVMGAFTRGPMLKAMYSMSCQLPFPQKRRYSETGCSSSPNIFPRILENSTISENMQENMCIIALAR